MTEITPEDRQRWKDEHPDYPYDDWHNPELEYLEGLLEAVGINNPNIRYSGFWSQGDGASFTGEYTGKVDEGHLGHYKLGNVAPIIERLFALQLACKLRTGVNWSCLIRQNSRYCHSGTMQLDQVYIDGADPDGDTADELDEKFLAVFRELADWIYRQLEEDYDRHFTDEAIDEQIRAEG